MKIRKRTWTSGGQTREAWQGEFQHPWKTNPKGKPLRVRVTIKPDNALVPLTKARAKEKLQAIYTAELLAGQSLTGSAVAPGVSGSLALGELLDAYIQSRASRLSPATIAHDRGLADDLTGLFGADRPVETITPSDLDDYVARRREMPARTYRKPKRGPERIPPLISAETVNKELKLLARACRWAVARTLLAAVPFGDYRPDLPTERRAPRCLTAAELERLLATLAETNPQARDTVEFLFLTGLRRGELARLTWGNVDLARARLCFVTRKRGSASDMREDVVYLVPRAVEILQCLRSTGRHNLTDYVFRSPAGGTRATWARNLYRSIRNAARRAGLEVEDGAKVGVHALRHTSASRLLEEGATVPEAAAHLRHRDGGTLLLRTYAHAHEAGIRRAAERMAATVTNLSQAPTHPPGTPKPHKGKVPK